MRWARLILTVSLMVGWTSAAAAECAWVLWEKKIIGMFVEWNVVKATTSFDTCEERRLIEWRGWSEALGEHEGTERVEGESLTVCAPSGCSSREWLCLPDTVDPREKKD